jgi:mitochondrial tryparedoxin peroxidase, trypanosomatid typical 2-Cys peroxiredoxin
MVSILLILRDIKLNSSTDSVNYSMLEFYRFVCPTEIIAFGDRLPEFLAINTQVIAASCDSLYSHLAWVNMPRSEGGLGSMKIPIGASDTLNS